MGFWGRMWGTGKKVSQDEVIELTNQFYVTLRAYFARVTETQPTVDQARNKEAYKRVQELLAADVQSWTHAYEIEQLLIPLYDERTLETELAARVVEARSRCDPARSPCTRESSCS